MSQIVQQNKSVEALKSLNNAIVTSRLYPPEAPQVANAVERGYIGIKSFLRDRNSLVFSFKGDAPCLNGQQIDQETLDSFPNLIVFRQLRMLRLPKLTIGQEMDRFAFGQLLQVFNATADRVRKEGGGLMLITALGLASYFPEQENDEKQDAEEEQPTAGENRSRKMVKVRPELLSCLFGMDKRSEIEAELRKRLAIPDAAIELLAAAVGRILQEILKKRAIVAAPFFPEMLRRAELEIDQKEHRQVALGLARMLAESLRDTTLSVLLAQEFPKGFGEMFYDGLIGFISTEKLGAIFVILREQLAKARLLDGDKSPQVEMLGKSIIQLMQTGKGKQFLGSEKARAIIHEGEQTRKKLRLEAGIKGLLQNNASMLNSTELIDHLPAAISSLLDTKEEEQVSALLKLMAGYCLQADEKVGEKLMTSLVAIGDKLLADGRLSLLDLILEPFLETVRNVSANEPFFETTINFLHEVMQASWKAGDTMRGDLILTLFYMVRSGQFGRSSAIKAMVGKVQDRGIQRAQLPILLAGCLKTPNDKSLGQRLVLQGPVAIRFLVESLINTENTADRMIIIDLLSTNNTFLASIIKERLPEHMPWFGKRNLLKLLGETGQEEDAECVLSYLNHDDFRVQREAFLCLYKIAGKNRKKLLLTALTDSAELIKLQIITALSGVSDQEVVTHLCDLLAANEHFSENNRTELIQQLVESLGRSSSPVALKGVESFLLSKGQRSSKRIPEHIWAIAEKARRNLESDLQDTRKKHVQATQLRKNAIKQAAKIGLATKAQRIGIGLPQEQSVRAMLAKGDKKGAKELLLQLIEKTARTRNFSLADSLRDWMVEIDPNAFGQIIQAAEIIDREKVAAIDKSHLEIWSKLYDVLTTEEFTTLYHSLKHKRYTAEEVIITQGTLQASLFFINSGKVKLYFENKGNEVLVKTLESGEIFGAGAFFDASVWTISVASVGTSEISLLRLDKLETWDEEHPGLESKLRDFCRKFERIEDFIEKNTRDRRTQERHKISGRVATNLLDNRGQPMGVSVMVELSDISDGGVSYFARISKRENSRLLLGRKVQIKLPAGEKLEDYLMATGDILAVRSNYAVENDYSVHVKFDEKLSKKQLQEAIRASALRQSQAI